MSLPKEEQTSWETETGLIHDVDAYVTNPRFGVRDEYAQKVAETSRDEVTGLMLLFDLADENGEIVATQGWSVGSGWVPADDGSSISHPKRANVVGSSMYGQLQNRVVKELKVDMQGRGLPTEAKSWNNLGFHWMQEEHPTVGGDTRTGLMPTLFVGERKNGAPTPAPATAPAAAAVEAPTDDLTKKLVKMAQLNDDPAAFQKAAIQVDGVVANDPLMSEVLDDGPEGFWSKHHSTG